jgi:hypothetical protein
MSVNKNHLLGVGKVVDRWGMMVAYCRRTACFDHFFTYKWTFKDDLK